MLEKIVPVILTVVVVGGATGAATYRVLDRSDTSSTSEDGAVVEPIYESASPAPTDAPTDAPVSEPEGDAPRQQRTQEPTTVVVVPRHTEEPTPFHEDEPTPHDTPEQDEEFQTEEPTPGSFEDGSPES